jgi:hypothetical protein
MAARHSPCTCQWCVSSSETAREAPTQLACSCAPIAIVLCTTTLNRRSRRVDFEWVC